MSIGKTSNSQVRPTLQGIMSQSSVYGSSIPLIFGRSRTALQLIWADNLREGASGKKTKAKKKGGQPTYVINADLLIGCNPIVSPLQFWANQTDKYLLGFTSTSVIKASGSSQDIAVTDPTFYSILGVTISQNYDVTFDDYGGSGSSHRTGSFERPLWNMATLGPDCTNPNGYRQWPFVYHWIPGTASIRIPAIELGLISGTVKIYYARLTDGVPAAHLRMEFEAELGTGSEFSGYESKQKLYPPYAGLGSPYLDLGAGGAMPNIRAEILGSYPVYSEGDADFSDIIEDIFKSGFAPAAYGIAQKLTRIQRGLGCYEYPGAVQKRAMHSATGNKTPLTTIALDAGVQVPNILVVAASAKTGWTSDAAISDSEGFSWTALVPDKRTAQRQFWHAGISSDAEALEILLNIAGSDADVQAFELAGVDTVEASAVIQSSGAAGMKSLEQSITTAVAIGRPCYILSWMFFHGSASVSDMVPRPPLKALVSPQSGGVQRSDYVIVRNPGTYTFTYDFVGAGGEIPNDQEWTWIVVAFQATDDPAYSKPHGNILDDESLEQCRLQCRANGIWGSLTMDSQKKGSEWLEELYQCMNAAPVWSGFRLKSIPRSEVSAIGNGAVYVAPTAAGPVADLGENDFVSEGDDPVITIHRKPRQDSPNLMQMQCPNRAAEYVDALISQPEREAITEFGLKRASPKNIRAVQNKDIAQKILRVEINRENLLRTTYEFKLKANWKLLEAMDLVTLTDPVVNMDHVPVRLVSVEEADDNVLECEAEPFIYGVHAYENVPGIPAVPEPPPDQDPYNPDTSLAPESVNPPVFVEPVALLSESGDPELWIVVSDPDPNYGGCVIYISTDDGETYNMLGSLIGSAITGKLTEAWPAHADPDDENDLELDLGESRGTIPSYQTADEDNFVHPNYVEGGLENA